MEKHWSAKKAPYKTKTLVALQHYSILAAFPFSATKATDSWVTDAMKKNKSLGKDAHAKALFMQESTVAFAFANFWSVQILALFCIINSSCFLHQVLYTKWQIPLSFVAFAPSSSWTVFFQSGFGKATSDCFMFHWLQAPWTSVYSERQLLYQPFPSCLKLSWESIRKSEQTIVAFRRL